MHDVVTIPNILNHGAYKTCHALWGGIDGDQVERAFALSCHDVCDLGMVGEQLQCLI
jgi:hypothetical protein